MIVPFGTAGDLSYTWKHGFTTPGLISRFLHSAAAPEHYA